MKHQFAGNKCHFCGVSIAVSGYSEECPARPDPAPAPKPAARLIGRPYETPKFLEKILNKKPGQEKCPRCEEYAWFNRKTKSGVSGFVGIENPLGLIIGKTVQNVSFSHICSNCGFERNY